jgi:hypothetical protein
VLAHNAGGNGKRACDDDSSGFYGNNTPSRVDNRWMSKYDPQGHYPIPQFLGGHDNQVLHSLSNSDHSAFHTMLNHALKTGGFDGLDGNSSTDRWVGYFTNNPDEQRRALDIVLRLSGEYDHISGTRFRESVKHNLRRGRIKWH